MKISRYKHDSETSYALGATLVFELLKHNPELITKIFLRPAEKYGEDIEKIIKAAEDKNIPILSSSKPFNVLNAKEACLLIAEFKKSSPKLEENNNHLLLVNPSDAGNLGTIMRTAVAFGIKNLAIIPPAVDPYDPKVIRASMGAIFHLNLEIIPDFETYKSRFASHHRYAFMLNKNAKTLEEIKNTKQSPYTIVMGNEAAGLPASYSEDCETIFIPQSDEVDSLNLSIATALALYSFTR